MRRCASYTRSAVYPRVCGGTARRVVMDNPADGLSPRVRGNPGQRRTPHAGGGSIPACAGEPATPPPGIPSAGVYPRVCGGTCQDGGFGRVEGGLSPRVRGNPRAPTSRIRCTRSIPACAGEPGNRRRPTATPRVYPRVCGGTPASLRRTTIPRGLSPRVRGNPVALAFAAIVRGSIPACAGEPRWRRRRLGRQWVYPRVCGGTAM